LKNFIPFAFFIHTGMRKAVDDHPITVYPNPVSLDTPLKVSFDSDEDETVRIEVYSGNGNLVHVQENVQTIQGSNTLSINLKEKFPGNLYPFGFAFVHVVRNDRIDKVKILID